MIFELFPEIASVMTLLWHSLVRWDFSVTRVTGPYRRHIWEVYAIKTINN